MSHHFDIKLAREDPSLNLCDFYLFDGPSGKTVMAMTVNPDVGLSAPDTLHPEGLYAFRFDLNGDAREEVTFKFRFGEVDLTAHPRDRLSVCYFPSYPVEGRHPRHAGEWPSCRSRRAARSSARSDRDRVLRW